MSTWHLVVGRRWITMMLMSMWGHQDSYMCTVQPRDEQLFDFLAQNLSNRNTRIVFYFIHRRDKWEALRRNFKIAQVFSRFSLYAGRVFAFHRTIHNTTCVRRGCVQWEGVKFEFIWGFHKKTVKYLSSNSSSKKMKISLCCENFPMLIHMTFVC